MTAPIADLSSQVPPNTQAFQPETRNAVATPIAEMERPEFIPAPFTPSAPFPPASNPATGYAETVTEGALAKAPATDNANAADTETLRQSVVAALANAGHASASQILGSGTWTLDGSNLRIEVAGMGKKMLSLTVNPAAEKIIRQELQRLGGPARFMVVPGEGSGVVRATTAAPLAGSVQEAALANPLVQRAKEIFNAEVRSVVDLRIK
jgi:DNA polymerase-3 subunit gamma/tau